MKSSLVVSVFATLAAAASVLAQDPGHAGMDHAAHAASMMGAKLPTQAGQAAFGAISEVVRLLETDPKTDWSRVNIEALRQHLIDMDDVTLHATVSPRNIDGGLEMDVRGAGRTADAIKRMLGNHARMLDEAAEYHAVAKETANGVLFTVTAKEPNDAREVAKIRALGFAGLITEGDHHVAHHLALARGDADPHGGR